MGKRRGLEDPGHGSAGNVIKDQSVNDAASVSDNHVPSEIKEFGLRKSQVAPQASVDLKAPFRRGHAIGAVHVALVKHVVLVGVGAQLVDGESRREDGGAVDEDGDIEPGRKRECFILRFPVYWG